MRKFTDVELSRIMSEFEAGHWTLKGVFDSSELQEPRDARCWNRLQRSWSSWYDVDEFLRALEEAGLA